jgi:hypothetical protein
LRPYTAVVLWNWALRGKCDDDIIINRQGMSYINLIQSYSYNNAIVVETQCNCNVIFIHSAAASTMIWIQASLASLLISAQELL